ncbi:BOP1 protein, partial [Illadopsis cleaveri]|nr:BOP1 protein [Illadopsis cleaveri]
RTVQDPQTGADVRLSEEQLELVQRLQRGHFGDVNFDPYEVRDIPTGNDRGEAPGMEFPKGMKENSPPSPNPRNSPQVSKLVHAIKMGWIQPRKPKENVPTFYDLWAREDPNSILGRHKMHVPAPKMPLPGHAESYNPPPEFLLSPEEEQSWEQQEPSERRLNFLPRKFRSLRAVPAYPRFIHERFERCLDLYLCPRQRKMRVRSREKENKQWEFMGMGYRVWNIGIIPTPTTSTSASSAASTSCSDDGTLRFWEVCSPCCLRTVPVGSAVKSVAWNPNPNICLVAAAVFISRSPGMSRCCGRRLLGLSGDPKVQDFVIPIPFPIPFQPVTQVTWHAKGDYWASVQRNPGGRQVLIHQSSRRWSQDPFRRSPGMIQCVQFHPLRPYFLVASQRSVRIYNLLRQELTKKLQSNCQWISSMAVHPAGDNVICGSYDSKLAWFDLDLSTRPYRLLRHHRRALRAVSFHRRYPLFASASDDGTVIVCHGMVY